MLLHQVQSLDALQDWLFPFVTLAVISFLAALYYERRELAVLKSSAAYSSASIAFENDGRNRFAARLIPDMYPPTDDTAPVQIDSFSQTPRKSASKGVQKLQDSLREVYPEGAAVDEPTSEIASCGGYAMDAAWSCSAEPELDLMNLVATVQSQPPGKALFSYYDRKEETYLVSVKVRSFPTGMAFPTAAEVLSVRTTNALKDAGFLGRHGLLVGQPAAVEGCIQLLLQVQATGQEGLQRDLHVEVPYLDLNQDAAAVTEQLTESMQREAAAVSLPPCKMAVFPVVLTARADGDPEVLATLKVEICGQGIGVQAPRVMRVLMIQQGAVVLEREVTLSVEDDDTLAVDLEDVPALTQGLGWLYLLPLKHCQGPQRPLGGGVPLLAVPAAAAWELERYFDDYVQHERTNGQLGAEICVGGHQRLPVYVFADGFQPLAVAMGRSLQPGGPIGDATAVMELLLARRMWECAALVVRQLAASGANVRGIDQRTAVSMSGFELARLVRGWLNRPPRTGNGRAPASAATVSASLPPAQGGVLALLLLPLTGFQDPRLERRYCEKPMDRPPFFMLVLASGSVLAGLLLLWASAQPSPGHVLLVLDMVGTALPLLPCLWHLHSTAAGSGRGHRLAGFARLAGILEVMAILQAMAIPAVLPPTTPPQPGYDRLPAVAAAAAARTLRVVVLALTTCLPPWRQFAAVAVHVTTLTVALLEMEDMPSFGMPCAWGLRSVVSMAAIYYSSELRHRLAFIAECDRPAGDSPQVAASGVSSWLVGFGRRVHLYVAAAARKIGAVSMDVAQMVAVAFYEGTAIFVACVVAVVSACGSLVTEAAAALAGPRLPDSASVSGCAAAASTSTAIETGTASCSTETCLFAKQRLSRALALPVACSIALMVAAVWMSFAVRWQGPLLLFMMTWLLGSQVQMFVSSRVQAVSVLQLWSFTAAQASALVPLVLLGLAPEQRARSLVAARFAVWQFLAPLALQLHARPCMLLHATRAVPVLSWYLCNRVAPGVALAASTAPALLGAVVTFVPSVAPWSVLLQHTMGLPAVAAVWLCSDGCCSADGGHTCIAS